MTQFPGVSQGKVGRVEERTVLAWTVATGDAKRRAGGEGSRGAVYLRMQKGQRKREQVPKKEST